MFFTVLITIIQFVQILIFPFHKQVIIYFQLDNQFDKCSFFILLVKRSLELSRHSQIYWIDNTLPSPLFLFWKYNMGCLYHHVLYAFGPGISDNYWHRICKLFNISNQVHILLATLCFANTHTFVYNSSFSSDLELLLQCFIMYIQQSK